MGHTPPALGMHDTRRAAPLAAILALLCFAPAAPAAAASARQYPPVLCYHQIVEHESQLQPGYPVILASTLEGQLRYLKEHGIRTLTMAEYVEAIEQPQPPAHTVLLTFDDGYESVYTILRPLLQRYGMHATAFVITSRVGRQNTINPNQPWLTWDQCRELHASGIVDIEAHGEASHCSVQGQANGRTRQGPYLTTRIVDKTTGKPETITAYRARVYKELRACKQHLDQELHADSRAFCWPFGASNADCLVAAREAGFRVTFCLDSKTHPVGDRVRYHSPENWVLVRTMLSNPALAQAMDPIRFADLPDAVYGATAAVSPDVPPQPPAGPGARVLARLGLVLASVVVGGALWALCARVLFRIPSEAVAD